MIDKREIAIKNLIDEIIREYNYAAFCFIKNKKNDAASNNYYYELGYLVKKIEASQDELGCAIKGEYVKEKGVIYKKLLVGWDGD